MRLGGPITAKYEDPDDWALAVKRKGYRAVVCPLDPFAANDTIYRFRRMCDDHDLLVAEVGAWSNPISPDAKVREEALRKCERMLALADRVAARCCVNIAGSRHPARWDGPHPDNLSEDTFDLIVQSVRRIIDAVRPVRTYYALEMMPWVFPDSPDSCLRLLQAVDRPRFALHLDPVNLINNPTRYYRNGDFLRHLVRTLGPHIRSCHAKDILMSEKLTLHLDEVRPGLGKLDYGVFLSQVHQLDPEMPLILEHLPGESEYDQAAAHIRKVAEEVGVPL